MSTQGAANGERSPQPRHSRIVVVVGIQSRKYAVEADKVVECVGAGSVRVVPGLKDQVAGFVEYRKQAVPFVDVGRLLGSASPLASTTHPKWLITRYGQGSLCAIGVSSVVEVTRVAAADVTAVALADQGATTTVVAEQARIHGELVPVLDSEKLFISAHSRTDETSTSTEIARAS
jgi:chemotaxis signal transduction protein